MNQSNIEGLIMTWFRFIIVVCFLQKLYVSIMYRDELHRSREKFDVIIGDLTHPTESGPSCNLYTKSFYELVAKHKLNDKGIFVTHVSLYFSINIRR